MRELISQLLNFEKKERGLVEAAEQAIAEGKTVRTWRNIPFTPNSIVRTNSFEKSIKDIKDPKMKKRIDKKVNPNTAKVSQSLPWTKPRSIGSPAMEIIVLASPSFLRIFYNLL